MNFSVIPARYAPQLLSLLRFVTGLLFLEHGTAKLLGFPVVPGLHQMMPAGMFYFTGAMELIGGLLITVGFLTRPVAFLLSGFMAFAFFMAHFPRGMFPMLNGGEPAILFCFAFLYLAAAGAGPISLEAALGASGASRSSSSRNAASA